MAEAGGRRSPRNPPSLLQRHDLTGSLARFWQSSYAADYLGVILLLVLYIFIQLWVSPFHRMFALDNQAIQYPHAEIERVPPAMLILYGMGVPFFTVALWAAAIRPPMHKAHVTFLGLLISIFLTTFLTDVIKNAVGRPRPDLLARCKPAIGTPEHTLVTFEVCTETNSHTLHDGWRSFPSGHSSFSFSGLSFIALFFASQLRVLHPSTSLPALLLTLTPLLGALLIAISRCEDYRHDVWDVTAGSLLGLSIAYLTFRRYYPGLRSRRCETPFPNRGDVLMEGRKMKDEEAMVGLGAAGPGTGVGGGGMDGVGAEESEEEGERGLLVRERERER